MTAFVPRTIAADGPVKLRPLEREDLMFVHQLNNNDSIMRYWFEEAYESFAELAQLYERNLHHQTERRFIIAKSRSTTACASSMPRTLASTSATVRCCCLSCQD